MKVKVLIAAALAVGLSGPALAAGDDKKADTAPVKEKKICRTEMVTGSLIAKRRICLTQAEWDQMTQNYQHSMDDYTSRGSGLTGTPRDPSKPQM